MKTKKRFLSLIFCMLMIFNSLAFTSATSSSSVSTLSSKQIEGIFEEIKEQIMFKYGDIYDFDNFSYVVEKERFEDDKILIDIDIFTDMTLIRHPSDSPFVIGMLEGLNEINDETEKKLVQKEVDSYIKEIETLYYKIPDFSVFSYSIQLKDDLSEKNSSQDNNVQYELFYRTNITSEEIILEPVGDVTKAENYDSALKSGRETIAEIQSDILAPAPRSAAFYNRLDARDYALDHATDTPEFSGSGNSDCANFVSKSLNAGGIPIDTTNNWFPATTYGDVNTCGINWMRTGYYNNGGVVPYMVNTKGYFFRESDTSKVFAGSIMYWTNTSHVALVTYGDGVTIKYTQHSNYKLSESQATKVYTTESAYFYKPESSILL